MYTQNCKSHKIIKYDVKGSKKFLSADPLYYLIREI